MSKNVNTTEKKKPVMTPRKTAVTAPEKKAQVFRVGFVLVLLIGMLVAPAIINWVSNRNRNVDADWLPGAGTTIINNEALSDVLNDDRENVGTFVYIGMAGCPACQEFEPILATTLSYLNVGLRHFQMEDALAENEAFASELFDTIVARASRGWGSNPTVPVIKLFVEGQIVDYLSGVQQQAEIIQFFERNGGLD